MKSITIETSEDFSLLYQGFIIGGNSQQSKTMQQVRREAKILDKLEDLSFVPNPSDKYPTGDVVRHLKSHVVSDLKLTQEEWELFKQYFEAVPWMTKVSREVVRLADLLDNAKEA
jgi:hypothetical protein